MPEAKPDRFLRQLGSGHIYHWTPTLAKRKDMVEIDPESAMTRISALKDQVTARLARIKDPGMLTAAKEKIALINKLSQQLNTLEGELAAAEKAEKAEAEAAILGEKPKLKADDIDTSKKSEVDAAAAEDERRSRILADDKEYQSILAMTTKQQIIEYLAANFGVKGDSKQALEKLRYDALEKRKERVFEV
jgi:hypothetical protein